MPTLREEMEALTRRSAAFPVSGPPNEDRAFDAGWRAALRDYGNYEIVEGPINFNHGICRLTFFVGDRCLGTVGNHIKILVPPRKAAAELDHQPSDRELKLETALRLIFRLAREDVALEDVHYDRFDDAIENIARRALEEKDE